MLTFVFTWGSVLGPLLDIVGAILVFRGVHISLGRAVALEQSEQATMIDDLGAPELLAKNEAFSVDRAKERVRAGRWAALGLFFFVVGFLFQAAAGWPKS